jgi:hypothetical protein
MDIFLKVKNSRWVLNLVVGIVRAVDGRNDDLVLLEEVAEREEARVADTLILPWRWCLGQGEKVAGCIAFGDLCADTLCTAL